MNADLLKENFEKALLYHPQVILYWGFEYWLFRKIRGDESLINAGMDIVGNRG